MIIIEQDAMLRVLNTANMLLPCHPRDAVPWITPSAGGYAEANAALSKEPPSLDVKKRSNDDFCPDLLSLEADEDCISLSSCSSAASSSVSGGAGERRVSFAAPLVTDVRTRPRTKDCDKRNLFYSSQETDRWVSNVEGRRWYWIGFPAAINVVMEDWNCHCLLCARLIFWKFNTWRGKYHGLRRNL